MPRADKPKDLLPPLWAQLAVVAALLGGIVLIVVLINSAL